MSKDNTQPNKAQMSFHEQEAKKNEIIGIENPNKPTGPNSHLRLLVDLKNWHLFPIVRKHLKTSQTTSAHEYGFLCFVVVYSFRNELLLSK